MSGELLHLKIYPDSVLRDHAQSLKVFDDFLPILVREMAGLMRRYNGIGLAAPQVGFLERLVVMDMGEQLVALVNPEIIRSAGKEKLEEGCLSLPDIHVDVTRNYAITVTGLTPDEEEIQQDFEGLAARVMQHEIDHLNGRLIIDYVSPVKKMLVNKRLRALAKQ